MFLFAIFTWLLEYLKFHMWLLCSSHPTPVGCAHLNNSTSMLLSFLCSPSCTSEAQKTVIPPTWARETPQHPFLRGLATPTLTLTVSLCCARLFATPCPVAHQVPQSMEFSRQEYWSGMSFPSSGDLPNPGIEPWSPSLADRFFTDRATSG